MQWWCIPCFWGIFVNGILQKKIRFSLRTSLDSNNCMGYWVLMRIDKLQMFFRYSVFVAQYIMAIDHTKVLHVLKTLLSAITLVSKFRITDDVKPVSCCVFWHKNGPMFDRPIRSLRFQKHSMKLLWSTKPKYLGSWGHKQAY